MSAKPHTAENCAKPIWVNLIYQHRGERITGLSVGMHGLPGYGDTIHHSYTDSDGNAAEVFGKVYSIVWAVTADGSFKATVRVEVRR